MANPVVLTNVSTSGTEARETLRKAHGVSLVGVSEEGTGVNALPDGVYGFTYSPALAAPLFRQFRYRTFEMHRTSGDAFILGFVTTADAEHLRSASEPVEITLQHDSTPDAPVIVGIPYSRIVQHRQFSVLNQPALRLQVKPE